jgi:hypothetical protein
LKEGYIGEKEIPPINPFMLGFKGMGVIYDCGKAPPETLHLCFSKSIKKFPGLSGIQELQNPDKHLHVFR